MNEAPVRLCCFQRHYGAQCPDGLVWCCYCFDRVPVRELSVDPEDGKPIDVCRICAAKEAAAIERRRQATDG